MFDDDPRDIEPTYSRCRRRGAGALLHVYFCENHKWNPAFDEHDEVIEVSSPTPSATCATASPAPAATASSPATHTSSSSCAAATSSCAPAAGPA